MKDKIINLLKSNNGKFVSGEKISEILGVTRASVWKHIKNIKMDGYDIESVTRKGYRLVSSPDILTDEEIRPYLNTKYIGQNIVYFNSIDSTNKKAKELGSLNYKEGTIVVSEEQVEGRGRLGRNWSSPKFKGIWMSIILRPDIEPINAPKITQIAAAATCKAIYDIGIEAYIKWPNDIVVNGKKVCGILTEMAGELNKINYIIVGIGINVNTQKEDFEKDIEDIATSIKIEKKNTVDRKKLLSKVLNNFEKLYDEFKEKGTIDKSIDICRERSAIIGKDINVINRNNIVEGTVVNLTDEGELIVKFNDGRIDKIICGEVSIRGRNGYI